MLAKKHKLKDKNVFQKMHLGGNFFSSGPLTVRISQNGRSDSRFGFVVGKKYSTKATERNRAKRVLRAATSPLINKVTSGFDIIVGIRNPLPGQSIGVRQLSASLESILKKNNVLK